MSETNVPMVIEADKPMSLPALKHQVQSIQQVMKDVMKDGEHFGTIPGCGDKPTLLQPGAQKLALTFGFASEYHVERVNLPGGHREYEVRCRLTMRNTGSFVGEGVGCASTQEGKFRFRTQATDTGKNIPDDAKQNRGAYAAQGLKMQKINGQWCWCKVEKVEHDNPADYYNTILKMAKKRAYVDALLTATAASDIFTQDIEDDPDLFGKAPVTGGGGGNGSGTTKTSPTDSTKSEPVSRGAAGQTTAVNNDTSGTFKVAEVKEIRSGNGKNGPWSIMAIDLVDGPTVEAFSGAETDLAAQAMTSGNDVYVEWEYDTKYKNNKLKELVYEGNAGPDDDDPLNLEPDQTIELVIDRVEEPKDITLSGKPAQSWAIVCGDERLGTFDQQVADGCIAYQGTNTPMELKYALWQGKHKVVMNVQVADSPF